MYDFAHIGRMNNAVNGASIFNKIAVLAYEVMVQK